MPDQDETVDELLRELIEVTRQNQRWLRLLAWDNAQEAITETLVDDWEYHLYEALDGETSTGDIADDLPPSRRTINRRLSDWQQVGIIEQVGYGKYQKIISLDLLNIDLPELEGNSDGDQ